MNDKKLFNGMYPWTLGKPNTDLPLHDEPDKPTRKEVQVMIEESLEPYEKTQDVDKKLDEKLDTSEIPAILEPYAKTQDVDKKNEEQDREITSKADGRDFEEHTRKIADYWELGHVKAVDRVPESAFPNPVAVDVEGRLWSQAGGGEGGEITREEYERDKQYLEDKLTENYNLFYQELANKTDYRDYAEHIRQYAEMDTVGHVRALPKTTTQTTPVGVDDMGYLWTESSGGGGDVTREEFDDHTKHIGNDGKLGHFIAVRPTDKHINAIASDVYGNLYADAPTNFDFTEHKNTLGNGHYGHVKAIDVQEGMNVAVGIDEHGELWTYGSEDKIRYRYLSARAYKENPNSIQNLVDDLADVGGGTLEFGAGEFILGSPIFLRGGVRIIGQGVKNTVLKASYKEPMIELPFDISEDDSSNVTDYATCLIFIPEKERCCEIAHMTLDGSRWVLNPTDGKVRIATEIESPTDLSAGARYGIMMPYAPNPSGAYDYRDHLNETSYVYNNDSFINQNKSLHMYDLCITGFDIGLYQGKYKYLVHTDHCYFKANGIGMYIVGDDSCYSNCEVERNATYGIRCKGGNSKFTNFKVHWNGLRCNTYNNVKFADYLTFAHGWTDTPSVSLKGQHCQVVNMEIQDQYSNALEISNVGHQVTALIDSSRGYKDGSSAAAGQTPAVKLVGAEGCILNITVTNGKKVSTDKLWTYLVDSKAGGYLSRNSQCNVGTVTFDLTGEQEWIEDILSEDAQDAADWRLPSMPRN